MDDPETYGPEFHHLPFSRAVTLGLLSNFEVAILAMSEAHVTADLQHHLASSSGEITLSDMALIVGCWRVLQNPEGQDRKNGAIRSLRRVIAFTNTIKSSQRLATHWPVIVEQATAQLPEEARKDALVCETRHVDGHYHALERKKQIDWLRGDPKNACRILSNARCLSEGVDVPALDAVIFMSPRNSPVDIVQAVGRTMRKAAGKKCGYIVLPVVLPPNVNAAEALEDNKRFAGVWSVLRALRSHDERFGAEINKLDLNKGASSRIRIIGGGGVHPQLPFPPLDLPPDALYARIVEKCGDRKYWKTWAKDVADIFSRLVSRIEALLCDPDKKDLQEWFEAFHEDLKVSINDSITMSSAINMMAQHILTRPVFEALFEQYDFAAHNPVSRALDKLREDFGEYGLENETRDLAPFYDSVRLRAQGLDNSEARQHVLMELYEEFFKTAMKKEADRLGIVYTPVEIVDFILESADSVMRDEFGRSLSDEGVHVLDPFTGTGIFLVRLIQSALIKDKDLARKYHKELHANELVLLAYYIAAIHIEEAFHGRRGADSVYEPFGGIVLTDTFNLHTSRARFPKLWLPVNSERAERQQNLPIQVIVGNPPWSAGQRSSADNNPNVDYPELEERIAETYAERSSTTNKNSLYDTYKMAIRWASDRVGKQGVVAFVTNGSWLADNVDAGIRACLAEEFSSLFVLNLRGHTWVGGQRGQAEGGNVFKGGARVSLVILVRNPNATHSGCRILYHDIGDYLKREEKLDILRHAKSIAGIEDWQTITPDRHHDWIDQRDDTFEGLYPIGTKAAKAGRVDDAIFNLYSRGLATGRDAYLYNFSREACAENARRAVDDYMGALREFKDGRNSARTVKEIIAEHAGNLRWDVDLEANLKRGKGVTYSPGNIWTVPYRPFVKQHCYVEYVLVSRKYRQDHIFPTADSKNRAICIPGIGSKKPFSVLLVDSMPDIQLMFNGQYFPRYRFPPQDTQASLFGPKPMQERIDNIPDTAWRAFCTHYRDQTITRDAIFDYIYGVLHAPAYRERFANNLSRDLPRIPFAPDFWAFADAGHQLADLHLRYETGHEYPLDLRYDHRGELRPEHFRIGKKKMRWGDDDRTVLVINDHIKLEGIPAEAHQYQVNGRTPLEWFIDRYRITQDTRSGIVKDPNGWFDDPLDLIPAFRRIVHVSVETVRIVAGLPEVFVDQAANQTCKITS